MRSKDLDLSRYDTDKVANRYLDRYDPVLSPLVGKDIRLLEIGIHRGGSLLLWRDYFPQGLIAGVDLAIPEILKNQDRIHTFQGSQADTAFLSVVAAEIAPQGFDVIIDDASHVGSLTRAAFWHLFDNHLKPGGIYVIEDWGTGYWDDWPDGRTYRPRSRMGAAWLRLLQRLGWLRQVPVHTHRFGMVGLIKELVDEVGMHDLSRGRLTGKIVRGSKFQRMIVEPGIVFVEKKSA